MDLKKFWRQYKNVTFPIVFLIASVAALIWGIFPLVGQSLTLYRQTQALDTDIRALRTKSAILAGYDEQTLRADAEVLTSAVPADKSLTTLFDTVNALPSQGVTISDLSLARPGSIATQAAQKQTSEEKKIGSNEIPFSLSVTGSFDQVKNFISRVAAVRRFLRIQAVDIFFSNQVSATARVTMNAFWSPFPTALGSVSQPISALTTAEQETIDKTAAIQLVTPQQTEVQPGIPGGKSDPFSP